MIAAVAIATRQSVADVLELEPELLAALVAELEDRAKR
jgi:hypothetical protein